jgi:hypothetical protein
MPGVEVKLNKFSIGADGAVEIKSPELATELVRRPKEAMTLVGVSSLEEISFGEFGEIRVTNKEFSKRIREELAAVSSIDELAVKNGGCGLGC